MKLILLNKETKPYFAGLYDESLYSDHDSNIITIGAVEDNRPVGVLLASVFLTDIAIQWIYVDERYRRRKVASSMLKALNKTLSKIGAEACYTFFTNDAKGMSEFAESQGFKIQTNPGWISYESTLKTLVMVPKMPGDDFTLSSFQSLGSNTIERFNLEMLTGSSLIGVPLRIDPQDFSPFSSCSIVDGHISSLLLVQTSFRDGRSVIDIPWLYVGSDGAASAQAMYNATLKALQSSFPPDTEIHFSSINPALDRVITKVLPRAACKELYMAKYRYKG